MTEATLDILYFPSAGASIFQHAPIKFDILYEAVLGCHWCVFMNMQPFYSINYTLDKRP